MTDTEVVPEPTAAQIETDEYTAILADVAYRRANPPARFPKDVAAVYGEKANYTGRDTLTPERAELARLRDALTAAQQEIEILQGELETARQAMGWMVE